MKNTNIIHPPRILRLRKRADFLRVRNAGQSVVTQTCIIQYALMQWRQNGQNIRDSSVPVIGVGYTATKKIGKATIRNRAKRRLRAVIVQKNLQFKSGYDIVLIARTHTPHCSWEILLTDIKQGLAQAGLIYNQR